MNVPSTAVEPAGQLFGHFRIGATQALDEDIDVGVVVARHMHFCDQQTCPNALSASSCLGLQKNFDHHAWTQLQSVPTCWVPQVELLTFSPHEHPYLRRGRAGRPSRDGRLSQKTEEIFRWSRISGCSKLR